MKGPIKMYRTRQIVRHDVQVKLPTCMYKLKNIHSLRNAMVDSSSDHVSSQNKNLDIIDQVKQFLKNNQQTPGMAELEAKQEDILKQLAELKDQILSIKANLKLAPISTQESTIKRISSEKIQNLPDVVVNINPNNPPYSLLIMQKSLQDVISLKFSSHLHSTVSSLPDNTKYLEQQLLNFKPKINVSEIHVRLIWKNISSGFEFLISITPLFGEVNLLRYLTRVIPSTLSYDQGLDSVEIDSVLDLCYQIVNAKTKTAKTTLLQSLNKYLGKSEWFLGRNSPSLADVAAFSAFKQISSSNDLSANLGKWFQKCTSVF